MLIPRSSWLPVTAAVLTVPLTAPSSLAQASPSLQLDKTEYRAVCVRAIADACTYRFQVVARYHNPTTDTLYLSRCLPGDTTPEYGIGIEAVTESTEDTAYDPIWACGEHDFPVVVAPNGTRVDTLQLVAPNSFDGKTHAPLGIFEGELRLIYYVSHCFRGRQKCQRLPEGERSQAFRVRPLR